MFRKSFLHIKVSLTNAQGNIMTTPVPAMDPTKLHLISPSLELFSGSLIQENNPSGMIVGDTIANPPGKTDFVTVGQNIKATYSFADPSTGKCNISLEVL